jgi:ATP-dependent RNA helicase DDX54/DBP10
MQQGGAKGAQGKIRRDKEDKSMKENKGKKTFEQWQKRNKMSYQKAGEMENKDIVGKARQLFKYRRSRRPDDAPESNGRNEIHRPDEILKTKKKNISKKLKNAQKRGRNSKPRNRRK